MVSGKKVQVVDLMKQEELTILNTIATAEGAISDIILNTDENICESKILILGFGRVAKVLALKLKALGAKVTCTARKYKDFAWMEAIGIQAKHSNGDYAWTNNLEKNLQEYDIVVNTVPHLILDESKLKYIKNGCLLIDLASKPGGIDQIACKNLGLKFMWSLAIPGKVSSKTSAKYIKETINRILKEGVEN
jgi:dipicolinate synthase subunit A